MSNDPDTRQPQFSLTAIFLLLCIAAIPLALLTQVYEVDAGMQVTLFVTAVVAGAYVVAILVERAVSRTGRPKARRLPLRRPLLVLMGVAIFLVVADFVLRRI